MPIAKAIYEVATGLRYLYGTAGFRMSSEHMEPVAFRVGLMAAALSSHYDGQVVGIMLTASHNGVGDNGVKLVGPDGAMLPPTWEPVAEALANTPLDTLEAELERYFGGIGHTCRVAIGRDTRPSGPSLLAAATEGAHKLGAHVIDVGLVTTPEFHTAVWRLNREKHTLTAERLEEDYISELAASFTSLIKQDDQVAEGLVTVIVDCANGVGGLKVEKLSKQIERCGYKLLAVNKGEGVLNSNCGADFVKVERRPPPLNGATINETTHFASLDGDADRLVYFTFLAPNNQEFFLIDGDRVSVLFAITLSKLMVEAGLVGKLKIGVVQTAYANGGSTEYIQNFLNIPVTFTSTGVKFLHEAAHNYDIGIYFEANGHGTVLFSSEAEQQLRETRNPAANRLLGLARLANPHAGDALSDLLLVEAMLKISNISIKEWTRLYVDRPSSLVKVPVRDRTLVVTTDADRQVVSPPKLQMEIDRLVSMTPGSRAFARASGTEDVIRIFAEADDAKAAQLLASDIAKIIPVYL